MQIRITDLTEGCCPERAEPGKRDAELTRRIERDVFMKLNIDGRQVRRRNIVRIALIAAVIADMNEACCQLARGKRFVQAFDTQRKRVGMRSFKVAGKLVQR